MTEDETVGWHHCLMSMCLSRLQEKVKDRGAWCAAVTESDETYQADASDKVHHIVIRYMLVLPNRYHGKIVSNHHLPQT